MPKIKTLQQEISSALKTYGVATKKDLENYSTKEETKEMVVEIVSEATDAILSGMTEMFKNVPTRNEFTELKNDVTEIKSDIHFIKDDIKNIEATISTLPTRLEFEKLKSQVNKLYV